ncbi:peptidase M20 [Clostridia bacterium]|nr:peptidase M20 [Clostridia bacterium]
MNRDRLVQTFKALVAIDSPSLSERLVCDYLIEKLQALGFTVFEDEVGSIIGGNCGNLYAYLDGNLYAEPLLFSAHMDTVEPSRGKTAVVHEDGKITSSGTTVLGADDLAGITAILEAVESIKEKNLMHRPIEILFCVAEELYGLGSKHFDYSVLRSKEAYILDLSGEVGSAAYKAPTLLTFEIKINGKASHAGFAFDQGIHAIAVAAEAIMNVKIGQIDEESTCNIGVIGGGLAPNIVPASCHISGEIRSYSHQKALDILDDTIRIFEEAAETHGATIDSESQVHIEAYETLHTHSVVKRFCNVCEELGLPWALRPTFGGSDNNHIEKHGISGLVLATAMNNCHSCSEYSSVSELKKITKIVEKLMTYKY